MIVTIVYRQAPGSWHPRGHPALLSTGNRLRAHEVPSTCAEAPLETLPGEHQQTPPNTPEHTREHQRTTANTSEHRQTPANTPANTREPPETHERPERPETLD
eukprot:1355891-Prymnesium_polylepis.1